MLLSLTYNPLLGALVVLGGISAFALRRDADRPAQTGTLALLLPWLACAGFSALARGDMLAQLRFMAPATPTLMALCAVGLERLVRRLPYTFALAGAAAVLVWAGASARQDLSTRVITPSRNRAGFGEGALAELSQPLGQVRMFEPPLGRLWGDAPRWVVSQVPWYFAWIMENIPQGGCVLFPDVGLLGFGLYDGLVLDARGLNSRGPARLLASQPEEGPAGMLNPGVQAFLQEFAQIRPAGLVLQAMDGRVWGPMEAALQGAGALDSYRGVATGSYVGQRNVRVYTLDVEPPSAEVVLERYRRLAKMAPGTFDWEGRLSELMSGRAKPAEHGQDTSEVWLYPAGEWSRAATGRPNAGSMRR